MEPAAHSVSSILTSLLPFVVSSPELENHLQISEKAVAEFIIDMAKDKGNVDEFKQVEGRGLSARSASLAAMRFNA